MHITGHFISSLNSVGIFLECCKVYAIGLCLKVTVKVHSLRSGSHTILNRPVTSLVQATHCLSNLISPGRIQRTHHTNMQAAWATQSQFLSTRYLSLLGRQGQYGMRSFTDTAADDQQRESKKTPDHLFRVQLSIHQATCSQGLGLFMENVVAYLSLISGLG